VVLVEQDKVDDAIARLEPALKKWKYDPALTYALTALYVQKEKVSEARALLTDYLKKNPKDVKAMRLQAKMYEKSLVESDKALDIYRKLLKIDPADVESRKSLASMLRRGEKPEMKQEALEELKTLLKYAPKDAEAWQDLGSLLEDLGKKDEAAAHYEKMAAALPDIGLPLVRLGNMAEAGGDTARARSLFDRALEKRDIGDLGVYIHLAKMYEDEGNAPGAEMLYKRGLESLMERSTKVFEEIMGGSGQGGGQLDLNKLLEIGEREKDLEKNTDAAIDGVTRAYLARNDRDGLMQYLTSIQEKYPRNKKLLRQMAKMERERGSVDRVLLLTNSLLQIDSRDVDAHMLMAWAYEQKDDRREASLAWRRAAEADPRNQDALNGFVDSYAGQGRLTEVIDWLQRKIDKQAGTKQLTDALERAKALEQK